MQSLSEKAGAIASVLWLLPEHYTCVIVGRSGFIFVNEFNEPAGWQPPVAEQFEGWPVENIRAWFYNQRELSRKYRLWAVGLAMQRLEREHPEQAAAGTT